MSGFLVSLCTLAAFALIAGGIYAAVCQLGAHFDEMQDADDFGDVHSEEY